jgi:hypothetical protein
VLVLIGGRCLVLWCIACRTNQVFSSTHILHPFPRLPFLSLLYDRSHLCLFLCRLFEEENENERKKADLLYVTDRVFEWEDKKSLRVG